MYLLDMIIGQPIAVETDQNFVVVDRIEALFLIREGAGMAFNFTIIYTILIRTS
jgi:hypothetical protein